MATLAGVEGLLRVGSKAQARKGSPSSRLGGEGLPRLSSRVTSALETGVTQTWGADARAGPWHRLESELSESSADWEINIVDELL
jgi:hypothetical protein